MNRYAFYFVVGLLCFSIGLFVVFFLYIKTIDKDLKTQNPDAHTTLIEENIQTSNNEDDYVTEEQLLEWQMQSFMPIINKWMKSQKIERFVDLQRDDELAPYNQKYATTLLIDVNKDGINELAIQTGCAVVGNCEFFLFKKKGKSYEIILQTRMVQRYKLRKTKTNGYFDLETTSHGSAVSGDMVIHKFNGKEYVVTECFNYDYIILKNGKSYELKKPVILRQKCNLDK